MLGQITYADRSPYCLGTERISVERYEEITRKIDRGEYVGLPVYAYVHSGSCISTELFSCPWDSGRSGWVYCTRAAAVRFGKNEADPLEFAREQLKSDVKRFNDDVLNGETDE